MAAAFTVCKRRKWHFLIELCPLVWDFTPSTNIPCVLKLPFCHLYVFRHSVDLLFIRDVYVIASLLVTSCACVRHSLPHVHWSQEGLASCFEAGINVHGWNRVVSDGSMGIFS